MFSTLAAVPAELVTSPPQAWARRPATHVAIKNNRHTLKVITIADPHKILDDSAGRLLLPTGYTLMPHCVLTPDSRRS